AEVLRLLTTLRERFGLHYLLISHDLAMIARVTTRLAVMDRGQIVEEGPTETILAAPTHPRTQALVRAAQSLDPDLLGNH
ncbi:MAG TPA: peptide ABC transporter ATP-binding protein, partial [Stellaceae bacterium]|nr:peptide ABC transporter ATP-binding protein [Stellaceae bacterium]